MEDRITPPPPPKKEKVAHVPIPRIWVDYFPGGPVVVPMQETEETQFRLLAWEDPLEEGMAVHSSTLAWEIPPTEESVGLLRAGRDWAHTYAKVTLSHQRKDFVGMIQLKISDEEMILVHPVWPQESLYKAAKVPKSEREKGGRLQRLEWPWKTKAQTAVTEYQRLKRHTFINLLILQGVISWWVRKISQNCGRLLRLHSLYRQVLVFQALCPGVRSQRHGKSFCICAPCNHAAYTASSHNPFDSIEITSYMACLEPRRLKKEEIRCPRV